MLHKDCTNFKNGLCMLYGVAVDPNGPTCPSFTARGMTATAPPQPSPTYVSPSRWLPRYMHNRRRFRGHHNGGQRLDGWRRKRFSSRP